ncbi:hypothetical protein MICAH_5230005 [Microcystis aeruginosa PCC 9809]|jgi:antitoxin YefM|uniref:Transposase n=1 Tax=Microcystis aeruginosa PCC 9809 TaxID=1160285 RepID=I4I2X7_MICAE|nr:MULTISPECIES: hypothetical protein [Microcystis]MCZ8045914.1 hypothetical protein [Microcystis sp. LE19-41.2A]MCZ8287266.1 hypothetical protein [Microcystis sp. LE19-59.1C]BCU14613.1 hypothetical protein MAN88_51770 [Microcystis aeruginosa]CCI28651.1 hypothetical protein MICAH_5230005 [Microcystis aeruginosa PCC 9809]
MAMLPIPTTYTSYTQAQEHFLQVLEQVELGNSKDYLRQLLPLL